MCTPNNPVALVKPVKTLHAAPGDAWVNPTLVQISPTAREVIALARMQPAEAASSPS